MTVERFAQERGITRLCHLTPFQNLLHIARGDGLRATLDLSADQRQVFEQQDLARLDGHASHICCSIQYPNVWYLRSRRRDATPLQRLFPDWVCVLIDSSHLWRDDTLMCPRNAAAANGAYIGAGEEALRAMFAETVRGSGGRTYDRGAKPHNCPTDDQAEILIHKAVPLADACRIVVADEEQAARVLVGLDLIGADVSLFRFVVAPLLFSLEMSNVLRRGDLPDERAWDADGRHAH
jgi:hypothetical protein